MPKVDMTPFSETSRELYTDFNRLKAGRALAAACHSNGAVNITGHGLGKDEITEVLRWAKRIFNLPLEEKMQAAGPPGYLSHRGCSVLAEERTRLGDQDLVNCLPLGQLEKTVSRMADFQEIYTIGSELDDQQRNTWLPDTVLPGFREYMDSLYEQLVGVAGIVLDAMAVGLTLEPGGTGAIHRLGSRWHCRLSFVHHRPVSEEAGDGHDWHATPLPEREGLGTFTLLLQDELAEEAHNPDLGQVVHADTDEGALVLSVGHVLQRFTNDYFISPRP
ncbi:hypothetical protein NKR19_g8879 [Coniochaeta hoffmannii]|uniref:Non-haem dioxygenase N-terminal domain-containing protein n=1 Tax=Coniochaeta hoffmannii TaxID=91930 RepID=A0AA38R2V6_9PEZI|nr:hypothetical protein NKR19_g8879 [Coniochaeta hoffmannii]